MELNIKITTSDSCKVIIQDYSEYLPEIVTGIVKNKFKYSDTISVNILQLNKIQGPEYKKQVFTEHNDQHLIEIPVKFDGWFTVNHIVLPSKDWFEREYNKTEASALNLYNIVYFSDGNGIYKYIDGKIISTTIDEILEINPIDTTIYKTSQDYISICFLRKCYINLCKQIFESRGFSSCLDKKDIDSELIYKRDLTWMAINVIKYLTECEQLYEVERIIESIHGCNGLCQSKNITSKTSGCGCSK